MQVFAQQLVTYGHLTDGKPGYPAVLFAPPVVAHSASGFVASGHTFEVAPALDRATLGARASPCVITCASEVCMHFADCGALCSFSGELSMPLMLVGTAMMHPARKRDRHALSCRPQIETPSDCAAQATIVVELDIL